MEQRLQINGLTLKRAPMQSLSVSSGQETGLVIPNDLLKLEEAKLLKELLYCFHGIDGQDLTVKHQSNAKLPVFKLASKVHESARQKVLHLAALGSMSKYLDNFIEQSCIDQVSLYRGALASAIQNQHFYYIRMLSEVECQLTKPDQVSFTRLRCQMHLVKRRLQWQVEALQVHRHSIGCNVLTALYFLIINGSPLAFDALSPIFLHVSVVFYEQLKSWFYGHQIVDPFKEFFILDEGKEHSRFSQDAFFINELACPQFLSKAQRKMILAIGQNYSWLNAILKEKDLSGLQIYRDLEQVMKRVTTDALDGVNAWEASGQMHLYLLEIETKVSRALIEALLVQGKLMTHLSVLTGFLLFRQSGFAAQLMSSVFDQSCQNASAFELKEKIQHVISNTLAPDQEEVHPELTIDLHFNYQPVDENDCCWDDFDVIYKVQKNDPLSLILTERVLQNYYIFFKGTLQLKRIDWILCDILKSIKSTFRKIQSTSHQSKMMEQIHLLAKEILVLTQQFLYNILSARLRTTWQIFLTSVKVVKSLKELEEAHDKYLDSIHSYIFPEQMHQLLQQTLELNDMYKSFRVAQELLLSASSDTSTPSKTVVCPSSVPSRLRQLRKDFYQLVAQLLALLRSGSEEHMLHLYELINVNGFFEPV